MISLISKHSNSPISKLGPYPIKKSKPSSNTKSITPQAYIIYYLHCHELTSSTNSGILNDRGITTVQNG